jgi:PDZ domain
MDYKGLLNVKNRSDYLMNKTGAAAKVIDLKKLATKWMLMSLLATVTLLMTSKLLAADANPYEKNYKPQNTSNVSSLEAKPDTKIYVSNHKDDDNISMLESGYDMMGSSGFEGSDVLPELALQHAKAIKADTVLIYKKYGSAKNSASKLDLIREAAKKGAEIDDKDLKEEPIQYKYYASYWAKLPAPLLGVHIIKLASRDAETEQVVDKKGLKVLAVIKDSPAAKAGLLRGDVLLKISDVELNKPEELSPMVRKFQGQNVAIEYERAGEAKITQATINSR